MYFFCNSLHKYHHKTLTINKIGNCYKLSQFLFCADENPSIGIILCADKDHLDVEIALQDINKPISVAEYQLLLPQAELQTLVLNELKATQQNNE